MYYGTLVQVLVELSDFNPGSALGEVAENLKNQQPVPVFRKGLTLSSDGLDAHRDAQRDHKEERERGEVRERAPR